MEEASAIAVSLKSWRTSLVRRILLSPFQSVNITTIRGDCCRGLKFQDFPTLTAPRATDQSFSNALGVVDSPFRFHIYSVTV
jgi:hypothetical protein